MFSFMSPMSLAFSAMCYGGVLGTECKYQPECLSVLYAYQCHDRNFGDIHTPEYKWSVAHGRNIKPRMRHAVRVNLD